MASVLLWAVGCADDDEAAPSWSVTTTVPPISVGTITATITPEVTRLAGEAGIELPTNVREILERIDELLQFASDVAVRVIVDGDRAIPEIGVGGFIDPATGDVVISMAPDSPIGPEHTIADWLPAALAHELDHSKRILEGPGYGTTLGEAIVTEGLADTFSLHAFPATPPLPWTNALDPADRDQLAAVARANATTTNTPDLHAEWFFGTDEIPRWAGYTIGSLWVNDYLTTHHDIDIIDATLLPAHEIIPQ